MSELLTRLSPVDLVLVEGFKGHPFAKLEVHRPALGKPPIWPENPLEPSAAGIAGVVAVATDALLHACDRPLLPLNEPVAIADWMLTFLALPAEPDTGR